MTGRSFVPYEHYRPLESAWLDRVPAGWATPTLGKCVLFSRNGCAAQQEEETSDSIRVTRIETISGGEINLRAVGYARPRDVSNRYRLKKGDIQLSNINSLSMIGNCALFSMETELYAGMNLLQIRPNQTKVVPKYLHWQMTCKWFRNRVEASAKPAINQASIPSSSLRQLRVATPPLEEQTQITRFLDYETARIDALIEKQQQLIALLKEKRQAVISHAVTKGLTNSPGVNLNAEGGPKGEGRDSPSSPDPPMRNSGVEWLGEIPAHWEVSQLKYLAEPGTSITYGIVQAGPHIEDGVPYIKTSDMSGAELPKSGYSRTTKAIDESYSRSRVFPGDIVISIRASVGKCLPVPGELAVANLTQGTAKISPGPDVHRDFLLAYLSAAPVQDYLMSKAKGATFKEITLDMLRRVPVLAPPLPEQTAIEERVRANTEKFDGLSKAAALQAELLQERRTALISAAVTGKIDVRDWNPPDDS